MQADPDGMNRRPVVYISGPVTKGDRNENYHQLVHAHRTLMDEGFAPINPGVSLAFPFAWEERYTHEQWLAADLPLVGRCDAVLRLPGPSEGADQELTEAYRLDVPVVKLIRHGVVDWGAALMRLRKEAKPRPLIGLIGVAGAGKDTATVGLPQEWGRIAIARPIYDWLDGEDPELCQMRTRGFRWLPMRRVRLSQVLAQAGGWESAKRCEAIVRVLLQETGDRMRALLGQDCLIRRAEERIKEHGGPAVITDLASQAEADWVRGRGGVVVRVKPGRVTFRTGVGERIHKTEMARIMVAGDLTIVNNGTPEELQAKLTAVAIGVASGKTIEEVDEQIKGMPPGNALDDARRLVQATRDLARHTGAGAAG